MAAFINGYNTPKDSLKDNLIQFGSETSKKFMIIQYYPLELDELGGSYGSSKETAVLPPSRSADWGYTGKMNGNPLSSNVTTYTHIITIIHVYRIIPYNVYIELYRHII